MLGPLCYPLLPRLLDKALAAAGSGIGVGVSLDQFGEGGSLNALSCSSETALAQIDAVASERLHILLIADDQIMPESSLGKLRSSASVASEWARATGQEYHVDKPDKTAVLLLGQAAHPAIYEVAPVVLEGRPVPCTLVRKWCGITWDAWLTFIPFLEARVAAARLAFKPLCALAREGTVPVEEVRAVMRSTVEGTLFFGAMFLIMSPGFHESLTGLQHEMERSLMGVPPWVSGVLLRASAGWTLTWGDRVIYEALAFRAELWCTQSGMLVNRVWRLAQSMAGRTFAAESAQLLGRHGLPDIRDFPGWEEFVERGKPVLPSYKAMLWRELGRKAVHRGS